MGEPAPLEVAGLTVEVQMRAGLTRPVDGLDFTIGAREIVGLVGESGSGKSLTSLALTGLKPARAEVRGRVMFNGMDLLALSPRQLREVRGRDVGYVFQDPQAALNPLMRCGDQIAEGLRQHLTMSKSAARHRAVELLEEVGLRDPAKAARRYPHELSGGMRQRVMIAMAISCEPRLIIADEPTTALDVVIEQQVVKLLRTVWERSGASMVFVSHDIGLVASLCHRIMVMHRGKIVESGPTAQVIGSPTHPYTQGLVASVPGLFAPRLERFVGIAEPGTGEEQNNPETGVAAPSVPVPSPDPDQADQQLTTAETEDRPGVLAVHDLRVSYGSGGGLIRHREEFVAVDGASFTLEQGEILGVVGESGSGKTSLARALIGLVQPSGGSIELDGHAIYPAAGQRSYRAPLAMQMVFQDPYASLNPRMRVGALVGEAIDVGDDRRRKAQRDQIVDELLERVGIDPGLRSRFPHQFSGGQRQRIAIARALAAQPRVLICDEAVSSLDVSIRAHVLNVLIHERLENQLTIVFIGHDLTVVRHLADRVLVMHNGSVVEQGRTEDVIFRPTDDYTRKLVQASALHAIESQQVPQQL